MKNTSILFSLFLLFSCTTKVNDNCGLPSLKDFNDTLDFIKNVKTYFVKTADRGLYPNSFCDNFYKTPFNDAKVCNFIDIFEKDSGITSCGLSAFLMAKLLSDNGINAYTYNYGIQNTPYTHVICLVEYRNKLIAVDPYMNTIFTDKTNEPLDFFELVELIKKKDYSKIIIETDTVKSDLIINSAALSSFPFDKIPEACKYLYTDFLEKNKGKKLIKQEQKIYFRCKTLGCHDFVGEFENELQKTNKGASFVDAFILKINKISGVKGYEKLDAKIDSALAH